MGRKSINKIYVNFVFSQNGISILIPFIYDNSWIELQLPRIHTLQVEIFSNKNLSSRIRKFTWFSIKCKGNIEINAIFLVLEFDLSPSKNILELAKVLLDSPYMD